MRINRICKICGSSFLAIKTTQFHCSRSCFKKAYYQRTKENIQDEEQNPHYPTKRCAYCEKSAQLNFDPLKNPQKYNAWQCPHCFATNRLILQYQNNPNSHQLIGDILIQFSTQVVVDTAPKYQTYHLPIKRPEQRDDSIVIMTCELLNILDIRKGNRKKIIFS